MTSAPPILLVEDNPMDVELTLRAFSRSRLVNKVEVARDGEEALAWLPRWDQGERVPLAVLLDWKLPRVSGLEVLRGFKGHPIARNLPVIVLTTSRESEDVRAAYDAGANSYIVKPVVFDKFVEVAAQINLYWVALNVPPYDH